nr:hypothetical protein [Tanacetum cinerariifolium]
MHKAFSLPVTEFSLPEELPTAREDSCHCKKKREATARKIALLSIVFVVSQVFNKDARLKPSNDVGKKVNEVPRQENKCKDQEEKDSVNITNKVNVVRSTINAASNEVNVVGKKSNIELPDDPNMPKLEDISIFEYSNENVFGAEADLNNLESTFQVSPIPTTRIHKDHPLKQLIRDLHSAPQTRRMLKNLEKRGLVSTVNQRTKTFKIVYLLDFYHKKNPKGNPFFERSKLNRGY